ncbi:MAG: hypothetical protein C4341_02110 [Armatimonadota bacterium]
MIASVALSGTYFEARTCSVFAGPCHVSGEVMTDGRTAVVAVEFDSGALAGYRAAAVIQSDRNLTFDDERRSVLYLDARASDVKQAAIREALERRSGIALGAIVAVTRAEISMAVSGKHASVEVREFDTGRLLYSARTSGRECLACSMPGELWYSPLSRGASADFATVEEHRLADGRLGETYVRRDEAAAFVGRFVW